MNRLSLLFYILFFSATTVFAQTGEKKDSLVINYMISSDLSVTLGNVTSVNTINKGMLELAKRIIGTKITAGYRYGYLDTATYANEITAGIMINLFPKNRIYGFIKGAYERSLLRGYNHRALGGAGVAFKVVDTKNHKFEPYLDGTYEYTNFKSPAVFDGDTLTERQTFRANVGWTGSHVVFKKHLIITHNANYSQSFMPTSDYRIEAAVNFNVPIYKVLSVKLGASVNYENIVPTGRRNTDFLFYFGLVVTNMTK